MNFIIYFNLKVHNTQILANNNQIAISKNQIVSL